MGSVLQIAGRCACIALLAMQANTATSTALDDVGYTRLQSELGAALPDGGSIEVTLVEANSLRDGGIAYSPNPNLGQFIGKTITDVTGLSTEFSAHANAVGRVFFGAPHPNTPDVDVSTAAGIAIIDSYWADDWLFTNFVRVEENQQPKSSPSRIANHSWIGRIGNSNSDPRNGEALRRLDWLVEADEFLQVVGFTGSSGNPLLGSAYNAIAVNTVTTASVSGTANVDSVYNGGRTGVDLVAPDASASNATARVSSGAALLADLGHTDTSLSTDPAVTSTTNRDGVQIYNAE